MTSPLHGHAEPSKYKYANYSSQLSLSLIIYSRLTNTCNSVLYQASNYLMYSSLLSSLKILHMKKSWNLLSTVLPIHGKCLVFCGIFMSLAIDNAPQARVNLIKNEDLLSPKQVYSWIQSQMVNKAELYV